MTSQQIFRTTYSTRVSAQSFAAAPAISLQAASIGTAILNIPSLPLIGSTINTFITTTTGLAVSAAPPVNSYGAHYLLCNDYNFFGNGFSMSTFPGTVSANVSSCVYMAYTNPNTRFCYVCPVHA
jgi:hypothetical protein